MRKRGKKSKVDRRDGDIKKEGERESGAQKMRSSTNRRSGGQDEGGGKEREKAGV